MLKQLASLGSLRSLSLHCSQVTDEGLVHLTSLSALEQLRLGGLRITDNGVRTLSSIRTLTEIGIVGTDATPNGVIALTKLPNVRRVQVHPNMVHQIEAILKRKRMRLPVSDEQLSNQY